MFPVMLSVRDRECLVVGGGGVALRKVDALLGEGARVRVVAPAVVEPLERLARAGRIRLERRPYRHGEAAEYTLAFAATNDPEVNRAVFEDADGAGVWVNVADQPELCTFHLPAVVRRGPLRIAVASDGQAPFAVHHLRRLLERRFGREWAEWADAARRFRQRVRALTGDRGVRERLYDRFFAASIDEEALAPRVLPETAIRDILGTASDPARFPERRPSRPAAGERSPAPGLVSLVGAGPGCAGLLTLRGYRRLMAADAVVYDRLAATALPPDLPASVSLHAVGKTPGRHPVPQEEINALLVRLARSGRRVVRLKGGDPFVFGRGGEEAEALAAAGIPFEIVPGVTAGIAVPAFAGIPVTHRGEAVRVTLLTAHECTKSRGPQVRWDLLARDPHATLVGFMGVTTLPRTTRALLDAGMDPQTPAAIVERGTTSRQRTVRATLATLPLHARAAGIRPPAVLVIGPTVARGERLDWMGRLPLAGRRILLTEGLRPLAGALELEGAEVVVVPVPLTPAARVVIEAAPLTDCVVRTAAEVEALDGERGTAGWGEDVTTWCLDTGAALRAAALGWTRVGRIEEGRDGLELPEVLCGGLPRAV